MTRKASTSKPTRRKVAWRKSQCEKASALRRRQAQCVYETEVIASVAPYFDTSVRGRHGFRNRQVGKPHPNYVHETPGRLSDADVRELRRRAGWGHAYRDIAEFFGMDHKYVKEVANYRARKNVT